MAAINGNIIVKSCNDLYLTSSFNNYAKLEKNISKYNYPYWHTSTITGTTTGITTHDEIFDTPYVTADGTNLCITTGTVTGVFNDATIYNSITATGWVLPQGYYITPVAVNPLEKMREILRARCFPQIQRKRRHLLTASDVREQRARETLRRVLGDAKFNMFIRNGFVTVKAASGMVYQIFPGHGITQVYKNGQMVDRLCVVLKGNFPPTDSLIMRYLLILSDEKLFREKSNKHGVGPGWGTVSGTVILNDSRSISDIFAKMKAQAA